MFMWRLGLLVFRLLIIIRKLRINSQGMKQSQQSQYFNDTITLLKLLKKTIAGLDLIVSNEDYQTDSSMMIYKITEQNKVLLQIVKRQKNKNHQSFITNNQKMKIKIKEWLNQNRNKYANGYFYKDIRSFLQQVEIVFGIFEKNQEFISLINKIYSIICDQLRIFKIKYDLFHQRNPQNIDFQAPKVRKTKSLILNTNFLASQSMSLSILYGLDLDYTQLKSSITVCKRNQIDFLQNQLERNRLISKQVDEYTKDYYLMMNRTKMRRKHNSQLYSREVRSSIKNLRLKTTLNDKVYHNFQKESKKVSTKQNREEVASTKLVYKINHVYVSGNQFDMYSDQSNQFLNVNRPKKKSPAFLTRAIRDPLVNRMNSFNTKQLPI